MIKENQEVHVGHKNFAVINPCRFCQPMGAVQALLGVKGAMPLIHGSQGCSTYMRFQLCRHYREPINVASTSMSEGTVVYGGEANLLKALKTIYQEYEPSLIGVTSSCLTETIGDDMPSIIKKFTESYLEAEDIIPIIPVSTPSYAGSHVEGYDRTIKALLENLTQKSNENGDNGKINIVTGTISPADVEEVKVILETIKCGSIILTDTSESLNAPITGDVSFLPCAGTILDDIKDSANSKGTISLCKHADSGASFLDKKYGVPSFSGPMPVGLKNTDEFIESLTNILGLKTSKKLERDRGRLIDAIVDAHSYNYDRKVAIYGDPDFVAGMTQFVSELGMVPSVICTGVSSQRFIDDVRRISDENGNDPIVLSGGDLYDLHEHIKGVDTDLLIGNSYGARIAKEENIPLVRLGFPIYDRLGAQRMPILGYRAGTHLVDLFTNTIIEKYYDDSAGKCDVPLREEGSE
ncbi:Nitrogenase molybdenum-iron protein beta chain [anaerobic digester metagenome]